ncbi:MAG: penicillin-binding transpeptidase domain-containing protein [Planctomycetota bacterium]|jgi:penicillin-binding protein 2
MYDKRIKICVILSAALLLLCLLRLTQMQLLSDSSLQDEIEELKRQRGLSRQLKTIRGRILDRKDRVLAVDEPQFNLHINYRLISFADKRVIRSILSKAAQKNDDIKAKNKVQKEIQAKLEDLQQIIDKCTYFGPQRADIEERIKNINNRIWNLRTFVAWARNGPDSNILKKYNHITDVPLSEAIADFEKKFPNNDRRLLHIAEVDDIADMDKTWALLELKTDDDIFTAQLEFMDVDGIQILPKGHRSYPHGSAAAQTIGWVGPAQEHDKKLFEGDKLLSYLDDDVCGREDGVEFVRETILRGRRGREDRDIDRVLKNRTEPQFGEDVQLSLDIELQKKIEDYLADYKFNPNYEAPTAAVLIEVETGDILALVSLPVFDLNRARYDYAELAADPNEPLRNRAINKGEYPPGSVIKPLILIAALESGRIAPHETIPCPAQKAPRDWPSCWLYKQSKAGHNDRWENSAHNAIKGSCNIYFSRLADRINPTILQQWLFNFGYGHQIPLAPPHHASSNEHRNFRQAQGQISTSIPKGKISRFEQIPVLKAGERRLYGIGQGNLRTTPLQVANAMATIARGGLYKPPRLFINDVNDSESVSIDLNISQQTLDVIHNGMSAVVNEFGGTAYNEFAPSGLAGQGIKVYGKTGSTEQPENAWFAGFATDNAGHGIAIAVIVEGGQRGSSDAAPLARDIIQFCIEKEYIGDTGLIIE